jgi:signal transduction histidine kinase/DNA-binding NarL/FixJ family response regulator
MSGWRDPIASILDLIGAAGAMAALVALSWSRTRREMGRGATSFLALVSAIYLFVTMANALQHLGITTLLDSYEDFAEILFFPFSLFFLYAILDKRELDARISAQLQVKHVSDVLRSVQRINELIVREVDPHTLLQETCRILTQTKGFDGAWAALVDDASRVLAVAHAGLNGQLEEIHAALEADRIPECAKKALEQHEVVDGATLRSFCEECPFVREDIPHKVLVTPIEHAGNTYGLLAVYDVRETGASPEDRELLWELAGDLGLAFDKLALQEEKVAAEARFQQAQKMEMVGRLAGGLAHDLRNQLTVIGGYARLLLLDSPKDSPSRDSLEDIMVAAQRSEQLVQRLLAFSRRQVLREEVVDPNKLLASIVSSATGIVGEDITMVFTPGEDVGNVEVDLARLEQAIMNLVVNARDAMPQGGRLALETENVYVDESFARLHPGLSVGPHVVVSVTDTGVGMDAKAKERCFEPFFTTKAEGKGTGLGLSMVYGFVRQSGGTISVYSEPGQGTTFKLYFPRVEAEPEERETSAEMERLPTGDETVLVAEDEASVRKLIVDVLRGAGYTVMEAASPQKAAKMARKSREELDLLITDVVMPTLSGPKLADRVREQWPDVEVLFVSGYTAETLRRRKLLTDSDNLLGKPFSPLRLAREVRRVLDGQTQTERQPESTRRKPKSPDTGETVPARPRAKSPDRTKKEPGE